MQANYWIGIYPFIDHSTGGNIDGMIAAANANLAATTGPSLWITATCQLFRAARTHILSNVL